MINYEYEGNIAPATNDAGTYYYVYRYRKSVSSEFYYGGINNAQWNNNSHSGVLTVYGPEINAKDGTTNIPTGTTLSISDTHSGDFTDKVVTIENLGNTDLVLSSITISGAEFSWLVYQLSR